MFNKLNTNITVEKIDTTETSTNNPSNNSKSSNTTKNLSKSTYKSIKESKKESIKESKKESKKESINESKKYTQNTKLTNVLENDIIKDIETLEDLPLVLSDISANEKDSYIDTETLFKSKKKIKKNIKSRKYKLVFPKTKEIDNNKYIFMNKYVKKNYNNIVDNLYNKKLLKNKNSPYRIVFHIYVNYLNEDLNIIFE